jgi:inosine-uridine nucleoside N-ribohydrolase
MTRKVILDCDPGIDDAVALAMALFDPRLEVVAVTATAGNVPADQASRNVQAIIEQLDPFRFPRVGSATARGPRSGPW